MSALSQLIQLLQLKRLEDGRFQGESEDLGLPQVFGGQLVAQALMAAMQNVPADRWLHACHSNFVRAGDPAHPIIYETEILREGNSFTTIAIDAKQHEALICRTTASFQLLEPGFDHQPPMPTFSPESFYSENALIQALAAKLPPPLREKFAVKQAFEVKIQYPNDPFNGLKLPPKQALWAKPNGDFSPENHRLQQCLLAYFSDFHCILTMLHPHECGFMQPGLKIATLDHSIWFHRPIQWQDGLYFSLTSPTAAHARGLTRGEVFSSSGQMLATYQQEALIRKSEV